MFLGFILGLLVGILWMNLTVGVERKINEEVKKTMINLEENLYTANLKIHNRDILIGDYQKEHEILLNNIVELKAKIVDLENNLEFVTNNSINFL